MQDLNYAIDYCFLFPTEESIFGVDGAEFDVFIEHGYTTEHAANVYENLICLPSSQSCGNDVGVEVNDVGTDGDDERDGKNDDRAEEESDNDDADEVERPKEDEEPEESKNERHEAEVHEGETVDEELEPGYVDPNAHDEGDDVVIDTGDGGDDERFRTLFEEGDKNKVNEMAYKGDGEEEEESDPEFGFGDVMYLDTPLESEEEWEQWDCKRDVKSKKRETSFMVITLWNPTYGCFRSSIVV